MQEDFSSNPKIGVFGGSGFYNIDELKEVEELKIDTPFGDTSDLLRLGKINGNEVVFLARHGRKHSFTPSEVPYKANVWAMKSLGVKWIISASAVGSLKSEIRPLDMVLPDQFIDRTQNRPTTFFGNGVVAHVSMAQPFCKNLTEIIAKAAGPLMFDGRKLHVGGTYLCMEGPAFSTKAESNFYRSLDCSVIGMTNHTEARLCMEAEIAYASLSMSTDYDCWYEGHDDVTVEMIVKNLQSNAELAKKIVTEAVQTIGKDRPISKSHSALKDALLTHKEDVSLDTLSKIKLLTDKYWS
ncbi:MAG: methylthioadenosine phosphorylase [bacterium TMED198]|nr:MAG: methylthioadenosine phosphorylase [bacterium TMED198]